jgi:hypothetical protein
MPEKKLGIVDKVKAVADAVVKAATPKPRHRCDPTGFRCDCQRKRAINTRSNGGGFLGPRRRNWLK